MTGNKNKHLSRDIIPQVKDSKCEVYDYWKHAKSIGEINIENLHSKKIQVTLGT